MKTTTNNLVYPLAILDVGSNSVRMMFVDENGNRRKVTVSTRLGEGLSFCKSLKAEAIERTVSAIKTLYSAALKSGAKRIYAFATAAVRNSDNGDVFVKQVKSSVGLDVDVVSGEDEAELSLNGALNGRDGGVIDVGGASSEVCFKKSGVIVYERSLEIGAVKLYDACGRDYKKIEKHVGEVISGYGKTPTGDYTAVGGTATSLAAIALKLKEYNPEIVDGSYISLKRLSDVTDELFSLTPKQIANLYCVGEKRADIIAGGCAIMLAILNYLKIDGITVSENDNLEGYLLRIGGAL